MFEHLFKINGFPGRKAVCQPTVQARRMAIHQSTDIDNVRALLAAGLSRSQIGDRLGMTRSTVGGLIYRMKAKGVAVPRRLPRPQSVKAKPQCDHSMRSTGTRDLPVEVTADAVPLIDISPRGCTGRWLAKALLRYSAALIAVGIGRTAGSTRCAASGSMSRWGRR